MTQAGPVVNGAEIAATVGLFFLAGFGLDTWLDTRPVFMIALTVFGVVGQFVRTYYAYNGKMAMLEHQRFETANGGHNVQRVNK
jgi:F0F1-type ATP synthase assembly protein I